VKGASVLSGVITYYLFRPVIEVGL